MYDEKLWNEIVERHMVKINPLLYMENILKIMFLAEIDRAKKEERGVILKLIMEEQCKNPDEAVFQTRILNKIDIKKKKNGN